MTMTALPREASYEPLLRRESRRPLLPRAWVKNGWSVWHIVMSVVMVALGVAVTSDSWADIVTVAWKDEENSQIWLVPIVAAWLVWVRRGRFRHCRPRGTLIGPLIMLAGWGMYWAGDAFYVIAFWHAGAIVLAIGCAYTILGRDVLFAFLPVVIVLAFLAPVPNRIRQWVALPLESDLTGVTQQLCDTVGMTVTRSGNHLWCNGNEVEIAEACNGLRMVFALVLVSFAFAFGTPLRWYVRLLVVAASPVSALLCNVVRLVPTVWFFGYMPQYAVRFHDIAGWLMLPIAFLLLLGIVRLLRWALLPIASFTLAYD